LLAYFSDSRRAILESTVKVILVKFIVSPYSPINAYFAVMLQSILGYILFFKGFNKISAILLGFLALLFSAFQKVIILTLVFGMTLWESIDIFFDFVFNKILPNYSSSDTFSLSYLIVGLYILSHLFGGLLAGWYAAILPSRLKEHDREKIIKLSNNINDFLEIKPKKKKRKWWLKPSSLILFIFSLIVISISFLFEEVDQNIATQIIIMLVRSILIIIIWYYFVSPILLRFVKKILSGKQKNRADEIDSIVKVFPNIKLIIKYSWSETYNLRGLKRIVIFLDQVLMHYLLFEQIVNEK
jgi:hypothetical protein